MPFLFFMLLLIFSFGCSKPIAEITKEEIKPEKKETIVIEEKKEKEEDQAQLQEKKIEEIKALVLQYKLKEAEKELLSFLAQNPTHILANSLLAGIYYEQRNYTDSLFYYQKVVELGEIKAENFLKIGNNYSQLKDFFRAMESYKKAIDLDPLLTEAYLRIGDIYLEWQQTAKAAIWYDKAVQSEKKNASTYYHLAKMHFDTTQLDKAEANLKEALAIDPMDLESRILEIKILKEKNNKSELTKKMDLFLKDFPRSVDGYLFLGHFFLLEKQYQRSFHYYQAAVKEGPEMAASYNGLGNYYYEVKNYKLARENYKKALALNKNYAQAYFNLGLVEWKEKKYSEAINYFLQSYELNPLLKEALLYSSICAYRIVEENPKESEEFKKEYGKKAVDYLIRFYHADAVFYSQYMKNREYIVPIAQIQQIFWKHYDKNNSFYRGLFLCMVESWDKAEIVLIKENNPLAAFYLSRIYLMTNKIDKAKTQFLKYIKEADKKERSIILLDSSFNAFKSEEWFLKALE